jgi:translation elongation factor EF-1beta
MKFSISITVDLDEYEVAVQKYCEEHQYDVPDYTTLIDRIQDDLEQLDGVEQVMFNHSSWIIFDLGTDNFDRAEVEVETVKQEIRQIFAKHGVK